MIVTNEFVYIHLHRTGGSFVKELIFKKFPQAFPDAKEIGYHFPLASLPKAYCNKPVFGFIRNPWDWYVSWYAFNTPNPRNPLFSFISKHGTLNFHDTIRNLVRIKIDATYRNKFKETVLPQLPTVIFGNRGSGITQTHMKQWLSCEDGYYSWLAKHMFNNYSHPRLEITRFEFLTNTVEKIFPRLVHNKIDIKINTLPAINFSKHKHYVDYYNNETKKLILEFEEDVISRFCFSFTPRR